MFHCSLQKTYSQINFPIHNFRLSFKGGPTEALKASGWRQSDHTGRSIRGWGTHLWPVAKGCEGGEGEKFWGQKYKSDKSAPTLKNMSSSLSTIVLMVQLFFPQIVWNYVQDYSQGGARVGVRFNNVAWRNDGWWFPFVIYACVVTLVLLRFYCLVLTPYPLDSTLFVVIGMFTFDIEEATTLRPDPGSWNLPTECVHCYVGQFISVHTLFTARPT